jgi:hypothetical protein
MSALSSVSKSRRPIIINEIRKYCDTHNIHNKSDLSTHEKSKEKRIDVLLIEQDTAELFIQYPKSAIRNKVACYLIPKKNRADTLASDVEDPVVEEQEEPHEMIEPTPLSNLNEPLTLEIIPAAPELPNQEDENMLSCNPPVSHEEFIATDGAENKALEKKLKRMYHKIDKLTCIVQRLDNAHRVVSEETPDNRIPQQIISAMLIIIMLIFCTI